MNHTLLLIRHAETPYNVDPTYIGGQSNWLPLTETGETQPRHAAEYVRAEYEGQVVCWDTSPAVRAVRTGEMILTELGIDLQSQLDARLLEMSQGEAEGKRRSLIWTRQQRERAAQQGWEFRLRGGESANDVARRMFGYLSEWAQRERQPGVTIATTHGMAIRWLIGQLQGMSHFESWQTDVPNCSVTTVSLEDGDVIVKEVARDVVREGTSA